MNTFTYSDKLETAVTIRNPTETFLHLDSNDRYKLLRSNLVQYDNTYIKDNNNFSISNSKTFGAGMFKRLAVTEVNFPWVTPNINERNNKFWFVLISAGPAPFVYSPCYIVIKEGFYTGATLATALQNQLNTPNGIIVYGGGTATEPGWVVNYNADQTFTITNNNISFYISVASNDIIADPSIQGVKTINDLTGFNSGGIFPGQPPYTYPGYNTTTSGVASLAYTRYVDITSNKFTKYANAKDSLTQLDYNNIVCRIYLDNDVNISGADPFGVSPCVNLYRQFKNPKWIEWNRNEFISDVDIKLYDDSGQLLYIPTVSQGSNFLLTFQLSES